MSSSEEDNFIASDDSEDFVPQPKKSSKSKAAAATTITKTATKAAPKSKSSVSKSGTKKPLAAKKTNQMQIDSDEDGGDSDVNMTFGGDDSDDAPAPPKKASTSKKTATETYTKMTQLEHVLKRPDTYIGSVEMHKSELWVYDPKAKQMALREVTYVPGFYKIFDEILVNAADNKVRDPSMTELRVTINKEEGSISVWNNGKGIPIQIHEKEKIYIPELIFGNLLTSSNYDDDEEKVTGGRNGYGAKLANIYSTEFVVETADKESEQKYRQVFSDNMSKIGKPKIMKNSKKEEYTCITFKPDLARFKMESIDEGIEGLMMKRVYDMAGTVKDIKVTLNKERLKIKNFKSYVEMYVNAIAELSASGAKPDENGDISLTGPAATGKKPTIVYEAVEDKGKLWEVAFAVSDEQSRQVSFVNNIATTKGGQHVLHVETQITSKLNELLKKNKKNGPVNSKAIHDQLMLFVNCQIVNPTFAGQTKEEMTSKVSSFGSKWKMSEDFIKKVAKSGVMEQILSMAKSAQERQMKRNDGHKRTRISGITKLEDANNAGTRKGSECTLILTEGDSAKALAVSGLTEVGRDNYGVFPLRGKLLNVREASHDQIMKNTEINHIKKIMGLQTNKQYNSTDSLRYGSLMIMTDQDHDGSHIKGLIINLFDHFYPSLLKLPNFLVEFITPIVKVSKGKQELSFFTLPEYETWKELNNDGKGWVIKYFKGLGTSTSQDAKKYFRAMNKHMLPFETTQPGDRYLIDLAFNKKKADDRKEWLRDFVPGTYLDHNIEKVPYKDFINRELILFSIADCARSIPNMVDGLKPGQRKVLFGCFKRKLKAEIKVAQLAGYVSEHSAYHHGEVSLTQTIVGLAQDFCGSNNVNILSPNGQFGTRGMGGKDAASARYIFTNIPPITRTLFHSADDALLTYLTDDGQSIEPEWYMPVLPLVLINGGEGIGTGWSTYIPNFNPKDIVDNLRRRMNGETYIPMKPWYRGFTGEINQAASHKFEVKGRITQLNEKTWEISELPVKVWTSSYKEGLEERVVGSDKVLPTIKEYKEYHTDTTVNFVVELNPKGVAELEAKGAEVFFKMTSSISTSNMVLFDSQGKIKKYSTPEEILDDFYPLRLSHYQKRKAHLVKELETLYERLSNQARFVTMIVKKELIVNNRKRKDLIAELREKDFRPFPKQAKAHVAADVDDNASEDDEPEAGASTDFDYLLGMAIYNLTKEKVDRLLAQRDEREAELKALLGRKPQELWEEDLDAFLAQWEDMLIEDERRLKDVKKVKKAKAPVKKAAKAGAKARKVLRDSEDESDDDVFDDDDEDEFVISPPKKKAASMNAKPRVPSGSVASGSKRPAPNLTESGGSGLDDEDLATLMSGNGASSKSKSKGTSVASKAKAAAEKASSSPPRKKGKVADPIDVDEDSEDYMINSKSKSKAGAPKSRNVSNTSAKSNGSASKSKAKGKGKSKAFSLDDDDEEMDDGDDSVIISSSPVKPRAAARGKKKPVKYVISDDEEEDGDDGDDDDFDG